MAAQGDDLEVFSSFYLNWVRVLLFYCCRTAEPGFYMDNIALDEKHQQILYELFHFTFRPLHCLQVSGSTAGSPASSSAPSTSSRQYTRQRITRVNLRDLIFYMEQERETAHSLLLYRALLK